MKDPFIRCASILSGMLIITFSTSPLRADSWVKIRATLFPTGNFTATSTRVKGAAEQVGDKVQARNVTVDASSFDSGISLRNKHIKQRFEAEKYPTITLVEAEGKNGEGRGKLKVKNIVKDVRGTYKVTDGGKSLEAKFKTKASDFNIQDVSYMGVGMEDELEVEVKVPLQKGSEDQPKGKKVKKSK